jgi:hypothetical protein
MFLPIIPFECTICKIVQSNLESRCYIKYNGKWSFAHSNGYGNFDLDNTSIQTDEVICLNCYGDFKKKND